MEEVLQTKQVEAPPPPPKPPVPVEVPDDEILENDELDLDASLDIDEPLADLPPPPPPAVEEAPEPEIFIVVEDPPVLIGGLSELQKKIQYPPIARKANVEGRVTIQFVVDEQGNVTNAEVLRGIGAGCDEEALRAVMASKFEPGKQRGKAVKVRMSLPVTFKLR
jgi:protein TonB